MPWAVTEFSEAELGDIRRTTRLVELAHVLAQHPTATLPEACGDDAMLKAAYRFFANDAIEPQDVLLSHIEATYGRLATVHVVLAVQDTTEVDWTATPPLRAWAPWGIRPVKGCSSIVRWRSSPERVPLGLVAQQAGPATRRRRQAGPAQAAARQPAGKPEWLTSLEAVVSAHAECPQTALCSMGDREADVYDLLAAPRPAGVELLIRASWNRCVSAPQRYVWATVEAQPIVAQLRLQVPRRGTQPAREATLSVRCCPLTLAPPRHRQAEGLPEVVRWAVQVREVEPPAGGSRSSGCC